MQFTRGVARETRSDARVASEGPRPTVRGVAFFFVARGPVPRDLHRHDVCFPSVVCDRLITNGSGSGDPDLQCLARERWRGEPSRMRVWHAKALALR